jgi:pyruvate/2-oxoglutarate/acetoin dehydrogenase E1 component
VSEALFGRLLAPVVRVGAVSAPLPYAKGLERLALPGQERLRASISQVTASGG